MKFPHSNCNESLVGYKLYEGNSSSVKQCGLDFQCVSVNLIFFTISSGLLCENPAVETIAISSIIKNFMEKGGRIIDSQDEVEGYPKVEMTSRKLDVPIANVEEWLAKMAREVE